MPKALYKYLRDKTDTNPNPVVATPEKTIQTSKQVTDYLLCEECEDRFNKGGERWVVENCWRNDTNFPLQMALLATTPLFTSGPDFTVYSGGTAPGVTVGKLAYFAASVMWRASVHQWKQYGQAPQKLKLGPYQQQLQRYLLGSSGFPDHIVLIVTVSTTMAAEKNAMMLFPWPTEDKPYHKYAFVIPGVTFQVLIGKSIPSHVRDCCLVHSSQQIHVRVSTTGRRRLPQDGATARQDGLVPRGLPRERACHAVCHAENEPLRRGVTDWDGSPTSRVLE